MSLTKAPKLLSPPVSPQTKNKGLKPHLQLRTSTNSSSFPNAPKPTPPISSPTEDNGPWLVVKPYSTNKRTMRRFFDSYAVRMKGSTADFSKKRKRSQNASEKFVTNKRPARAKCTTSDTTDSESQSLSYSEVSSGSSFLSSKSDNEGIIRDYRTRSKKSELSMDSIDQPNNSSSSEVESSEDLNAYHSKREFLESTTVQEIHDAIIDSIPTFAPDMSHITHQSLEKELKRVGFSTNRSLKDRAGLEMIDKDEVILVSSMKLSPYQYHDTKKRFFAEKARKTFLRTTFKKTDAQKACRVDVNKASKLYEIFQSCGLLKDELYTKDE